jgi:cell division protein FtsN
MRSRVVLLVVAILLVAGFAALNWSEIVRPAPLLFGPVVIDAAMGAILLGLLALTLVGFLLSAGAMRTRSLMESRHHYKELEAQRLLADKAEASRFTELRQYLEDSHREMRERDAMHTTEWQRELRAQMEAHNRMISARLNELEHRLESRFERMGWGGGAAVPPVRNDVVTPGREPLREPMREPMRDPIAAQDLREAQLRDEERLRDERISEERELRREDRAEAADRRTESGWRRWF